MTSSALDKLKEISKAFNSSTSFEQLAINLDLACLSYDEAEKLFAENNQGIIRHMSAFWCENRKFSFKKAISNFDSHDTCYHDISRFALPYGMMTCYNKDYGSCTTIRAIAPNGKEIENIMSADLAEDVSAFYGIDAKHEMILAMMYEITREMTFGC